MKKEILSLGLLIIVAVGLYLFSAGLTSNSVEKKEFTFAGKIINVEIADDVLERTRGLSGRESLSEESGLLFVFEEPGQHGFWMKDMNFPIDILWFDEEKRLIYTEEDVSPETFPETFHAPEPSLYVLEVNVGEFSNLSSFVGQTFELSTVKSD
jgi:uncharacterized membrane protein (UPF0127 family)